MSYAVDVRDIFGLRSWMLQADMNRPALWYHIFAARKFTEVIQWVLLAFAAVVAGLLGGRLTAKEQQGAGAFWTLISVGTALLLVEDAGNVRDILGAYFIDLFPHRESAISLFFLLAIFGAMSLVLVYALVRHGRSVWGVVPVRPYLTLAYGILAIAAISDVAARVGLYEAAGLFVHNTLAQGQLTVFSGHTLATQAGMFMDSVWEEALELVGYAAFLAAGLAYGNADRAVAENVPDSPRRSPT